MLRTHKQHTHVFELGAATSCCLRNDDILYPDQIQNGGSYQVQYYIVVSNILSNSLL